jgi:hypothetical protein
VRGVPRAGATYAIVNPAPAAVRKQYRTRRLAA